MLTGRRRAGAAMVIVGAGQAGGRAALTLHAAGHDGPIVLLGADASAPSERPPLSKEFLRGEHTAGGATLRLDDRRAIEAEAVLVGPR